VTGRQDLLDLQDLLVNADAMECLVFQALKDIEDSLDWMELRETWEDLVKREKMEVLVQWVLQVHLVHQAKEEKGEGMVLLVSLE